MKAGVDIGGTKISVCLSPDMGSVARPQRLMQRSAPTVKTGAPGALAQQVMDLLDEACAEAGVAPTSLTALGVASCGPFVIEDGAIALAAPNICGGLPGGPGDLPNDWRSAPLEAPLRARFPKLHIANDAAAALAAERRWGALQRLDHCAYVTWSTGVGIGLCVDGQVLRGKHGNAGHAGHSFVDAGEPDARCGCGNVGDVEGTVSGLAMQRRFGQPARALLEAAEAGDAQAQARVDALCLTLGRMLYNLVVTLDLQRIAIGGSVFWHHRALLLPRLQAQITGRLPALTAGVTVVAAGLGAEVGDYAALALAD